MKLCLDSVEAQCNIFGLITSKLSIPCLHQKISKLVTWYLYWSYYYCCIFHHWSVYRCFGTDVYFSVCSHKADTALVTMCVWMYREEEECSGQSSAYVFPDAEAELLWQLPWLPPPTFFFFFPEQNRLGCFVVSFPGRHTPPISNMGGTEELILLHSVSKATLPTQKHRQYAQLQILRHWCKDSLTNQSTRIYYYLLAISQATELYRLAVFFLFLS